MTLTHGRFTLPTTLLKADYTLALSGGEGFLICQLTFPEPALFRIANVRFFSEDERCWQATFDWDYVPVGDPCWAEVIAPYKMEALL